MFDNIDLSRQSNSLFSVTTSMISPTKILIENVQFADDNSIIKSFVFRHVADSRQSKYSKNCYLYWYRSIFKITTIKISVENTALLDEYSTKKSSFFSLATESWVRKFQRKPFDFNFSRYSNSYFTKTTVFFSSIRVGIENFLVVEKFSMGELSICAPCIRVLTVRKLQKVLFSFISLNIQTCNLQPQ